MTNEELRHQVRHALRVALAHAEEARLLRIRAQVPGRLAPLDRLTAEYLEAAKRDRQTLHDRHADPGPELLELWTKAGLEPFEPEARAL